MRMWWLRDVILTQGGLACFPSVSGNHKDLRIFLHRLKLQISCGLIVAPGRHCPAARALASAAVEEKAFCPIGAEKVERAKELIDACGSPLNYPYTRPPHRPPAIITVSADSNAERLSWDSVGE